MKANSNSTLAQDEVREDLEICISCLETNLPETAFCMHCGTPLTSYAATAPFESIFAEGDFWRKAVRQAEEKPARRILIEGFLILMVLAFLLGLLCPR
jgi:predicted amidophosphoribosyltransferase